MKINYIYYEYANKQYAINLTGDNKYSFASNTLSYTENMNYVPDYHNTNVSSITGVYVDNKSLFVYFIYDVFLAKEEKQKLIIIYEEKN